VGGKSVYITEGADPDTTKGWPEVVSVSDLAARQGRLILLVTQNNLPDPTKGALQDLEVNSATVIWGTSSVSD